MTNEEIGQLVKEWTEHVRSEGWAWRKHLDDDDWALIHNAILGAVQEAIKHDAALGFPEGRKVTEVVGELDTDRDFAAIIVRDEREEQIGDVTLADCAPAHGQLQGRFRITVEFWPDKEGE